MAPFLDNIKMRADTDILTYYRTTPPPLSSIVFNECLKHEVDFDPLVEFDKLSRILHVLGKHAHGFASASH